MGCRMPKGSAEEAIYWRFLFGMQLGTTEDCALRDKPNKPTQEKDMTNIASTDYSIHSLLSVQSPISR